MVRMGDPATGLFCPHETAAVAPVEIDHRSPGEQPLPTMQAPTQTLQVTQRCAVVVKLFANDGTEDTTSALSTLISNGSMLSVTPDPTDNRKFVVKATSGAGQMPTVTFNRAGTVAADPLVVPFALSAAPNFSRVELVSVDPLPPG